MRAALVHPHVLEDLGKIGIKAVSYASHAGYEHRYARLLGRYGFDVDLIVFSRSLKVVQVVGHVWGIELSLFLCMGFVLLDILGFLRLF